MPNETSPPSHRGSIGTHYALTWGVGDQFGGMTTAMLARSAGLAEAWGVPIHILVYLAGDYDAVRANLSQRGLLADGVTIRSMYEDLRDWSDSDLESRLAPWMRPGPPGVDPATFMDRGGVRDPGGAGYRTRYADTVDVAALSPTKPGIANRGVLQRHHLRDDGSVFLAERRDVEGFRRLDLVLDSQERPIGMLTDERDLLKAWLDTIPRDPVAWVIIDSKSTARSLADYQSEDLVKMHLVHGHHQGRKETMSRLESYDAVVFLTEAQRADVVESWGDPGNTHVVGNICDVPPRLPNAGMFSRHRRRSRRGVMLSRIDNNKRVDSAGQAVIMRTDVVNPFRRPYLDHYGVAIDDVAEQVELKLAHLRSRHRPKRLHGLLRRMLGRGLGARAVLLLERRMRPAFVAHGYSPQARREFAKASFSLMTSKKEGFGMVVVESMGRGCVPISFDLPYGPRDIITDGVDGFLVPNHDVKALSLAIDRFLAMPRRARRKMRKAAHARALDFTSGPISAAWADVMASAVQRK